MTKEDIVKQIIKDVGGSDNINNAWHCMTRLRFDLKDEKKVDYAALEKTPKVVGTKYQSNQLQVVIGTDVADYYAPLAKELGLDEA
ncbi:PTS beta-glucoside transporter subunit EIIBCA, partial [Listeria monocytogenes]|nr:PTS beta-glucoside transporter subunit EIIBCA [Listeria monocytogenes]